MISAMSFPYVGWQDRKPGLRTLALWNRLWVMLSTLGALGLQGASVLQSCLCRTYSMPCGNHVCFWSEFSQDWILPALGPWTHCSTSCASILLSVSREYQMWSSGGSRDQNLGMECPNQRRSSRNKNYCWYHLNSAVTFPFSPNLHQCTLICVSLTLSLSFSLSPPLSTFSHQIFFFFQSYTICDPLESMLELLFQSIRQSHRMNFRFSPMML